MKDTLSEFRRAMEIEHRAVLAVLERSDEGISDAVDCLYGCRGKIVAVGMGKCGFIAQKIAATLLSTGSAAVFLHPAEALHGDLALVTPQDVALILSNSGETEEITALLPHLKRFPVRIVALTGYPESTLGRHSDAVINTRVDQEADPLDIAPTASTTVMLAVGDALASVLMKRRGFTKDDYAVYHPGGSIGQKLLCRVEALMHTGKDLPVVTEEVALQDAIFEMTSKRLGCAFVVNETGEITGILTDGDLRRILQREKQPLSLPVRSWMTRRPKVINREMLAVEALRFMEDNLITILPVIDPDRKPIGALHIHDLIRAGIG